MNIFVPCGEKHLFHLLTSAFHCVIASRRRSCEFRQGEEVMPKRIAYVIILICLVLTSCSPVANNGRIKWVTLEDIEKSLGN